MLRLSQHIAYLLTRHDCVVVPGFGAFIANTESARYDDVEGIYLPPSRHLSFNPRLTHNDGLLATSVSRREEIGYDAAMEAVGRYVDMMRYTLERDGELSLPGVGVLTTVAGASPAFEPSADCSANIRYSYLPSLPLAEVAVDATDCAEADDADECVILRPRDERRRRVPAFVGVAASVALLLGLGFGLTAPGVADSGRTDYASVGGLSLTPSSVVTDDVMKAEELFIAIPGEETVTVVDTAAHSAYCAGWRYRDAAEASIAKAREAAPEVKPAPKPEKTVKQTAAPAAQGYCLVVASLQSRSKAEKFIRESGDSSLRILSSGPGRYRVYVATAATSEECEAAKAGSIGRRYPDAWVCER